MTNWVGQEKVIRNESLKEEVGTKNKRDTFLMHPIIIGIVSAYWSLIREHFKNKPEFIGCLYIIYWFHVITFY